MDGNLNYHLPQWNVNDEPSTYPVENLWFNPTPTHQSLVDTHGPFSLVASIANFGILLHDVYLHHFLQRSMA